MVSFFFKKSTKEIKKEVKENSISPISRKKGNGAAFNNNRKRTNGRKLQYVPLDNGRTKLICHFS